MAATHKQAAVDLILGTGSFGTGTTGGSACTGDKVQIQKIIDEFKKRGYNHVDTARNYVCSPPSSPTPHHAVHHNLLHFHSHSSSLLSRNSQQ